MRRRAWTPVASILASVSLLTILATNVRETVNTGVELQGKAVVLDAAEATIIGSIRPTASSTPANKSVPRP